MLEDLPDEETDPSEGFVIPSFARGSVFLQNTHDEVFRLSWNEGKQSRVESAPEADRRRALPAGDYTMIGYRLNRLDQAGERWDLAASRPNLRKVTIKAGAELELSIDESIHIGTRLHAKMLGVSVAGEKGSGLTIYRSGKRIPMGFDLLDGYGKAVVAGKINYG